MNLKKKYYTLSEPQKMIYWGEMMFPNTTLNTMCATYELGNQNNIEIMKVAISKIINENPGLHLRIHQLEGVAYQYRHDNFQEEIQVINFQDEKDNIKEDEWIKVKATYKYDFFDSKFYNFYLFIRHDSSLNLLIQTHHIISDAWTHLNLATQIKEKYDQLINNKTEVFNSRYSYLDYIKTEKDYFESKRYDKAKEYWVSKFKNLDRLPKSITRKKSIKSPDAERYKLLIDDHLQSKILNICSKNNIGYPSFFLSCLLISLERAYGNKSHFIGTLSYNRLGKDEKKGVGMFVNTLPLYVDLKEDRTLKDVVSKVRSELKGLLRHQRYPLSSITNDEQMKNLNIAENIEIIYSFKNNMMPYSYTYQFNNSSIYPIVFRPSICETDGSFYVDIDFQTNLFTEDEIKVFGKNYIDVIERLDLDIDSNLNFESVPFKHDIPFTKSSYNLKLSLKDIFENSVKVNSNRKAVSIGDRSLTYNELNNRANFLAEYLISKGCGREKSVVLLLERSFEMMVAILAVLKTGSCFIPLSAEQPIRRIKKIVKNSGASLLLSNTLSCSHFSDHVTGIDLNSIEYSGEDYPNPDISVDSSQLAYIMYTSGSSGEPKGVMLEHKAIVNRLFWMQDSFGIDSNDKLIQKSPYFFDVSVWELFWWFFNGSSMHFLQPDDDKDSESLISEVEKNSISIIHFTPSSLNVFLDYLDRGGSREKVKSLKHVICSGEVLSTESVKKFKRLLGDLYGVCIHNLYGPTEAAIDVTSYKCSGEEDDFIPIGKPINNVEVYILGSNKEILPQGISGEIHIGGECLARGYLNNPDLTESQFYYHPDIDERLYRTGDLGLYLHNGNIKFLGRVDNQVKVRGNRVEPGEVENYLLAYNGIKESVVIPLVDDSGSTYLGAYFTADTNLPHEKIRHFLQKELPSYMIPSFFVQMDFFPLTPNGKIDRKALSEPENSASKGKIFLAPINEREEVICEIWEDVLKVEKISRQDNFFDLGGDSLALIKVHFALQEKFDVELQSLFEFQTIETLSSHLQERRHNSLEFDEKSYRVMEIQRKEAEKVRNYYRDLVKLPDMKTLEFESVLITGATGYLGAYITREYLTKTESELYLLVRGDNREASTGRLVQKLEYYFGNNFYERYKERVHVVSGDLTEPSLGFKREVYESLGSTIDSVIHCAADVRHFGDWDHFNSINVDATQQIIDFCKYSRNKTITYISTMSVGLYSASGDYSFNFIESDNFEADGIGNVYLDSKIMAENLVRKSFDELEGKIIRVGNIVHDSETGIFQENRDDNGFISLLTEYRKKGCAPRIDIPFIDLSYVNETARAVQLLTTTDLNGTFHVFNPETLSLSDFCEGLGLKTVPVGDFISSLAYGHPLLTHGYYLEKINLLNVVSHCEMTNAYLNRLGFNWSSVDFKYIENILTI